MKNISVFIPLLVLLGCGNGVTELSQSGVCDGYTDYTTSPYKAPFQPGDSYTIGQGNCGPASHTGNAKYAYDITMSIGTNVIAARAGTVHEVVIDKTDGNGCADGDNHIYITHSDGTMARYVHLTHNGSMVTVGETVTQGQVIGLSGNTGCTSGAHLHFQVDSDDSSRVSIPVNFSNVGPDERGLIIGKTYSAQ